MDVLETHALTRRFGDLMAVDTLSIACMRRIAPHHARAHQVCALWSGVVDVRPLRSSRISPFRAEVRILAFRAEVRILAFRAEVRILAFRAEVRILATLGHSLAPGSLVGGPHPPMFAFVLFRGSPRAKRRAARPAPLAGEKDPTRPC
jgi:hypothetical protein